jgi:hypothetical protein
MPNHVTNILTFHGKPQRINELLKYIQSDEVDGYGEKIAIDFNKIIPMPPSLNITSGGNIMKARLVLDSNSLQSEYELQNMLNYPWVIELGIKTKEELIERLKEKLTEQDLKEGEIAIENEKKYGHSDWYGWRANNWGTKWNAYNVHIEEEILSFDTAWSAPELVIRALSIIFPDIIIKHEFADEDIGHNCGVLQYLNGNVDFTDYGGTQEGVNFAIRVKGWEDDEEEQDIDNKEEEPKEISEGEDDNDNGGF